MVDLRAITLQYKGPYRDSHGVMHSLLHSLEFSQVNVFTISVSTADFSIQTQMERIRSMRVL